MQLLAIGSKISVGSEDYTVTKIGRKTVELVDQKGRISALSHADIEKGCAQQQE